MATEESLMLMDRYSMSVLPELLTSGFGLNHNTLEQLLDPSFLLCLSLLLFSQLFIRPPQEKEMQKRQNGGLRRPYK